MLDARATKEASVPGGTASTALYLFAVFSGLGSIYSLVFFGLRFEIVVLAVGGLVYAALLFGLAALVENSRTLVSTTTAILEAIKAKEP
jgi:hypothetical protein